MSYGLMDKTFGTEFDKRANKLRNLPIAVNCAEYNEQSFGTVKTPKKPEAANIAVCQTVKTKKCKQNYIPTHFFFWDFTDTVIFLPTIL